MSKYNFLALILAIFLISLLLGAHLFNLAVGDMPLTPFTQR